MNDDAKRPLVTIIIPSWTGEVGRVMTSIEQQTYQDYEVDVVKGVSPAARARNVAARRAHGDLLLFIDDDAYFGHPRVLETLVRLLQTDSQIAVAGTSKLVPVDSTPIQQAIARQVPRTVYPVVSSDQETNPPLDSYGFTAITTTCCLVRRAVFMAVGGFDEGLTTGPEDTDFFYRVRRQGHRLVIAGDCWVYHDAPAGLRSLLRKSFWYGVGHALEARKNPERNMAVIPLNRWYGKLALLGAPFAAPGALFVHLYFDPARRLEFGFRPLKMLSTYAVLYGYGYGWFHGAPRRPATTYMGRRGAGADRAAGRRPARVLYVDAFPKIGGGQRVLYALVTRLAPERYTPVVALPPDNPLRGQLEAAGVRTVGIAFDESNYTMPQIGRPGSVLRSATSVLRVVREIARVARRERVDLIHANSAVVGVHALPAAILLGIPCVVHSHDFLTAAFTNRWLKGLLRYKRGAMIFVSGALAGFYGAARDGSYCYRVIHNGVDTALFHPDPAAKARLCREYGLPGDCFLIGTVGRIEPGKGIAVLLDAFARLAAAHPEARLLIVGEVLSERHAGNKQVLLEKVRRLALEKQVVFTGFRDDIPAVMAGVDVLAFSPVGLEGFPTILLEAMACRRPVVTVPIGGIPEQVFDGENGLLVPVGDAPALAAALERLIAAPELARRLGDQGRRLTETRFSLNRQAAETQALYDAVLHRRAPVTALEPAPTAEAAPALSADLRAETPVGS